MGSHFLLLFTRLDVKFVWKGDLCTSRVTSGYFILDKGLISIPGNRCRFRCCCNDREILQVGSSPLLINIVLGGAFNWCLRSELIFREKNKQTQGRDLLFSSSVLPPLLSKCLLLSSPREKMPFHHVTAGLLYKGNYLSRSLSDSDSDVLASISVEELDGKASQ